MPKRGAATSTTRRSRSLLWPVISACTGAAKPSAAASAGTSCTRPSVIRMAPATRSCGTSDERRRQRGEQPGAVGLAVGLPGLDEAHFEARDAAEPLAERGARRLGLLGAGAEILARALVDHHGGDRGERLAVLARDRRVGERQHEQRERQRCGISAPRLRANTSSSEITTAAMTAAQTT